MLITLDEVKKYCRVQGDSYDEALAMIVSGVYGMVSNIIGGIDIEEYTEENTFTDEHRYYIFPKHYPIVELKELYINGEEIDLNNVSGIYIEDDIRIYVPYTFYSYKIVYTAGYETIPAKLKYAILYIINQEFLNWLNSFNIANSLSTNNFTIKPYREWPGFIQMIISSYRRIF